jgi:Zn ribbon nucleic-acid-binding protein
MNPNFLPGGKCPACQDGFLKRTNITRLECPECGWEADMKVKDSFVFLRRQSNAFLEIFVILLVVILIVAILLGDRILKFFQ